MSGAEVVDGNLNPQSFQLFEDCHDRGGIFDDRAFGNLEAQIGGRQLRLAKHCRDLISKVGLDELLAGQIDVYGQASSPWQLHVPGAQLSTRFANHPRPDRNDKTRLLCYLDEAQPATFDDARAAALTKVLEWLVIALSEWRPQGATR